MEEQNDTTAWKKVINFNASVDACSLNYYVTSVHVCQYKIFKFEKD